MNLASLTAPTKLHKREKDTCLQCVKMELGEPDSSGRRRPVVVPNSEYDVPCDYAIFAIGQELDTKLMEENNITLSKSGFIEAESDHITNISGGGVCWW